MRAAGAEPLEPYPGNAHAPWRCRCLRCGAEVTPRVAKIRHGRGPCLACGNREAGERRQAAHVEIAEATMRALGLEPVEPYPGALTPWRCRCVTCGREVTPRYANAQGLTGCAYCFRNRVDPDEAAEAMRVAGVEPLTDSPAVIARGAACARPADARRRRPTAACATDRTPVGTAHGEPWSPTRRSRSCGRPGWSRSRSTPAPIGRGPASASGAATPFPLPTAACVRVVAAAATARDSRLSQSSRPRPICALPVTNRATLTPAAAYRGAASAASAGASRRRPS